MEVRHQPEDGCDYCGTGPHLGEGRWEGAGDNLTLQRTSRRLSGQYGLPRTGLRFKNTIIIGGIKDASCDPLFGEKIK